MSQTYTKQFINCKAVFQGGGCKGIAYVGAYQAAFKRGVFFSELAGTSAGSIVAAFIAAGATPDTLMEIVRSIDFDRFVRPINRPNCIQRRFEKILCSILKNDKLKKISDYFTIQSFRKEFGIFDSKEIEDFVEDSLFLITNKHNLTFNDIIPNLHIVCSDLKTHNVKIWNRKNTPDEPIAKAVRASCSIPIFFTPTDRCYVDGGMLSNLPVHIFSEEPHYNKVLCFRNEGESKTSITGFGDYLLSLVGTIIDGAVNIQQKYLEESYDVVIKVDGIQATDFQKLKNEPSTIDLLLKAGEESMNHFLDLESTFVRNSHIGVRSFFDTEEKMHSMVAELTMNKHDEICVIRDSTAWAWNLFLSIVKWINDGTNVRIVLPELTGSDLAEESRRRMLKAMGCHLILGDNPDIKLNGFFFKRNNFWTAIMYEHSSDAFSARFYKSSLESQLLGSILSKYTKETIPSIPPITIKQNKEDDIIDRLKTVPQYSRAKLKYESVPLESIVFLNPYIRSLKYRQIQLMFDLYNEGVLKMFSSTALLFPNGKESLVGPPVVEFRDGKYYLIEGNTRCVFAYRHGIKELRMVVAEDVSDPLPCSDDQRYQISQVLLSDQKLEGKTRYDGFEQQRFRHIEAAIRPYNTYML